MAEKAANDRARAESFGGEAATMAETAVEAATSTTGESTAKTTEVAARATVEATARACVARRPKIEVGEQRKFRFQRFVGRHCSELDRVVDIDRNSIQRCAAVGLMDCLDDSIGSSAIFFQHCTVTFQPFNQAASRIFISHSLH